jgi:hypothetical protein
VEPGEAIIDRKIAGGEASEFENRLDEGKDLKKEINLYSDYFHLSLTLRNSR